ncbi:hypothetical protein J7J47_11950 [Halomonas sp. ISL-60]|uniref:hypothetical protein n=1 Tax=Halomonas sp. ISL-56 TaxID=2819149 RepID=UPI001BEC8149|nr:hypothetical protein [Halomonas sp. ISL-56]MBT2772935.1 hypothetical protein [Halomonas sp. ISL-60]MBT2799982.1 hypothetical protein [Halomonas sp. ISL-56]
MLKVVFFDYKQDKMHEISQDAEASTGAVEMNTLPRIGETVRHGVTSHKIVDVIHFVDNERYDARVDLEG